MDYLDELTMEHLNGEALYLAETIGMDAFKRLISVYGSSGRLYIPAVSTLTAPIRNRHLYEDFQNGATIYELAAKYGLGESSVRNIIRYHLKSRKER